MRAYHTEIEIAASVQKVWAALTDFKAYPEWNPLIRSFEGELRQGAKIKVFIIPVGQKLGAKVVQYEPYALLAWQGAILSPFLMKAYHYYQLEALDEQTCLLKHGERFLGWGAYFMPPFMLKRMEKVFEQHNRLLKERLENK